MTIFDIKSMPSKTLLEHLASLETRIQTLSQQNGGPTENLAKIELVIRDIKQGVSWRETMIQNHKKMLLDDPQFIDESNIQLNGTPYNYQILSEQSYLGILTHITGVYDSCARLCVQIHNPDKNIQNTTSTPDICQFFFRYKDNEIYKVIPGVCRKLASIYGYQIAFLNVIRNIFAHRGRELAGLRITQYSDAQVEGSLKEDELKAVIDIAKKHYSLKEEELEEINFATVVDAPLLNLIQAYLPNIDHAIGTLINALPLN